RSARDLVPDLPVQLEEVVMRGLATDPALRFATAREMAAAFEDAVPRASSRAVGEWVERTAAETLESRAARIAVLERDPLAMENVGQPPAGLRRLPRAEEPTQITLSLALERPDASLSAGEISAPEVLETGRGARRLRGWLVGGAAAVVAVGLLAAASGRHQSF